MQQLRMPLAVLASVATCACTSINSPFSTMPTAEEGLAEYTGAKRVGRGEVLCRVA